MTDIAEHAPPRLRRAPAERAVRALLPACAGAWTAAEIMHACAVAPLDVGLSAAAAAALAGVTGHRATAAGLLIAGAWSALAVRLGPLAYPGLYCPLTGAWAVLSFCGWRWARSHPSVVAARDKRNAQADWLGRRHRLGLGGSHLLHHERTRLGERMIVDVKGTGRRASSLAHGDVAERIAEEHNLSVSRVRVTRHRLAGRIEISIRTADPWEKPIPHPALVPVPAPDLAQYPALDLGKPFSIRRPAVVGQDPETGRPLHLPLWDGRGGKNITIVGQKGAGKTVLLNDISERVTAAGDALMIRVNLSIKGLAEAKRWGPACHLTAFGRQQQGRALKVLCVISKIIEWRSQQEYETDVFTPSPGDPEIVLIMDEIDSAAAIWAIRRQLEDIASKGREYGVTLVRSGQRGTAEWTGGGNVRANDDVFCLGMVNRASEAMHAAGNLGLLMPDMAAYGEGHGGVWVIAETGGEQDAGRSFMLKDPPDIARIVAQRADCQPDLKPELKAFLGKTYEELLSTDVYARWARGERPVTAHPRPDMAPEPAPDGTEPGHAPAAVLMADPLDAYDREAEDYLDDDLRSRWRKQGEKLAETRRTLEEASKTDIPDIPHEDLIAHAEAQWRALGEATEIPEDARAVLLRLLTAGTTISEVATALGVSKWTARIYLERLRGEGRVRIEGEKRRARWLLNEPGEGDAS